MTKLKVGKSLSVFLALTLVAALAAALVPASPARAQAGAWAVETVDSAVWVGQFTSLALDSGGNPHISYEDGSSSDLKYARWTGAAWAVETVDAPGGVGAFTSIALDSSNYPHISYYDGTNYDLKYARYDGAAWQIETVDSAGDVGRYISLALDSSNRPHISYFDYTNSDLKYARFIPAAPPPPPPPPPAPRASPPLQRPLNPPRMSLQYLSINPQQTSANQPVTIITNVVNTGDEAGNYNVALKINGQVEQSRMVSVGPQGTQPVKFTVTKAQAGTYTVDIAGQKGSFIILGAGGSTTSSKGSAGLIAILILGMLVLVTVIALLLTRRSPA